MEPDAVMHEGFGGGREASAQAGQQRGHLTAPTTGDHPGLDHARPQPRDVGPDRPSSSEEAVAKGLRDRVACGVGSDGTESNHQGLPGRVGAQEAAQDLRPVLSPRYAEVGQERHGRAGAAAEQATDRDPNRRLAAGKQDEPLVVAVEPQFVAVTAERTPACVLVAQQHVRVRLVGLEAARHPQ